MERKLFNRLSVKVFLISFVVQFLSGMLLCFVLYSRTPEMLYSPKDEMDDLMYKLSLTPREESGDIIDDFISRTGIKMAFYIQDEYINGAYNSPIQDLGELTIKTKEEADAAMRELSDGDEFGTYGVTFKDDPTDYMLQYYYSGGQTNLIPRALHNSYPILIAVVASLSIVSSVIYTILFASPVRRLSKVSREMANMDFTVKCDTKRGDEIGDLARDLNTLSVTLDSKIKELEAEIERVHELENQKEMFFAAASHELKTPVTILEGHIRGMLEGVGPYEDHEEYLSRSLRTVKRMESLINEILTASRMQSSSELNLTRVDMAKLIKATIEEASDLLDAREMTAEKDIEEDLFFEGNLELTSLAVNTFMSNAVFYGTEGSAIEIGAHKEDGSINVTIKNRNAHIDEKDLEHLFEPFYRTDASRSRRNGGSGLGLYLARLIITKQNGECSLINDGPDVLAKIVFPSI